MDNDDDGDSDDVGAQLLAVAAAAAVEDDARGGGDDEGHHDVEEAIIINNNNNNDDDDGLHANDDPRRAADAAAAPGQGGGDDGRRPPPGHHGHVREPGWRHATARRLRAIEIADMMSMRMRMRRDIMRPILARLPAALNPDANDLEFVGLQDNLRVAEAMSIRGGFRAATALLDNWGRRNRGGNAIEADAEVEIENADPVGDVIRIDHRGDGDARYFRQFVTALGQQHQQQQNDGDGDGGQRRGRTTLALGMDWRGLSDDDMERLFGTVLPRHPFLNRIIVNVRHLPPRLFRTLTESIPIHSSITSLTLEGQAADHESQEQVVQVVVDMLRRNAAAIRFLTFRSNMDPNHCRRICEAVPMSAHLYSLILSIGQVRADTLLALAASTSLRRLEVSGYYADGAVLSFAQHLRTNESIQHLELRELNGNHYVQGTDELTLLLTTYCLHLETLEWSPRRMDARELQRFRAYGIRNAYLRNVLENLNASSPSRPRPNTAVLPHLLGLAIHRPTYVYRVLKKYKDQLGRSAAAVAGGGGGIDDNDHHRPHENS